MRYSCFAGVLDDFPFFFKHGFLDLSSWYAMIIHSLQAVIDYKEL